MKMNEEKREIRTIECGLAIREAAQDENGQSRTITGTAIVFNRESQVLDDWGEKFREIILPEAVTMAFLNTQDIKLNILHDRKMSIARRNKGAANSSLRLTVDGNGVNFEVDAPRCDIGDRALELIRTGVYTGCSFEFIPEDYEKRVEGDSVTIVHRAFKSLNAITIGMDPAYVQTAVNVREMKEGCGGDDKQRGCGDDEQRGCGGDDEKRGDDKKGDKQKESDKPEDLEEMEREREARAVRAYEARKRELELAKFKIRNNY